MFPVTSQIARSIAAPIVPTKRGRDRRSRVTLIRVQLLGGFLVAVLIPAFLRWGWDFFEAAQGASLSYSILGTLIALVSGYFALRQLIVYPGVEATVYILPSFAISY